MNLMKTMLAYICYYIGDFMYKLSDWSLSNWPPTEHISSFFWMRYQQFMDWSIDFDVNNKVWTPTELENDE
jgi:hypothetical protein